MSLKPKKIDPSIILRRFLFFTLLTILTIANLFALFRGLNSRTAMEHAQIAREISRGNGFTTKSISPAIYYQASDHQKKTPLFTKFEDTYHSPLNPLLNAAIFKLIGANDASKWQLGKEENIFELDRIIASVSTVFFLLALGVTYLLVCRMFDAKIGAVTAILMLFCESFWEYSVSGLPQMLMLFLFSCAIYFAYRATEDSSEDRTPFLHALAAGFFFTLLAMTHFLAVWIAIGYIIYISIALRPRGIIGISVLLTLMLPSIFVLYRNYEISGSLFGSAIFNLSNGIGGGVEESTLRSVSPPAPLDALLNTGFLPTIIRNFLIQTTDLVPFLAGILIAPLFFIALLHPFKSRSVANFRWSILIMFIVSAFGLCFFGISREKLDPNQLHLLFAPIMSAYGLAFISVLWSRLPIIASTPMLHNAHHVIIIFLCSIPFIVSLPFKFHVAMNNRQPGFTHWPPYFPPALNRSLASYLPKDNLCFSDQPWAVGWYADRISIWLPPTITEFNKLDEIAKEQNTPISGILISPVSHGSRNMTEINRLYQDFSSLVFDGKVTQAALPAEISVFNSDPKLAGIAKRFRYRQYPVGLDMVYYTSLDLVIDKEK